VPNLDEAVDFFVNIIGCEPFYELGPFQSIGAGCRRSSISTPAPS
jgi:hypothetical protein